MNKYELLYIIASDVPEEKREELIKKFSSYIESKGGSVEGIDKWGMRKYAYPINFKNEGFYVLMNITMKSEEAVSTVLVFLRSFKRKTKKFVQKEGKSNE